MKKVFVVIFLITLWQLYFNIFGSVNSFLPSPLEIIIAFIDGLKSGEISEHILNSLLRVGIGFFVAAILGIGSGLFVSQNKKIELFLLPIIDLLQPIPPIAWIPIAILMFGLGNTSAYFIVFMGGFFPIFTNTYLGVSSIPNIYKNIAKTYEFSPLKYVKNVLFGYSLPYIFTGLRVGMSMSWMSVIAAELIGAQSGLGYFIQINRLLLRTDNVVLGMILIGVLGMTLNKLIIYLGATFMPWRENHYD